MKIYKHSVMPTAALIPYANNARIHSTEQVKQLASSMKEWGFTNPILVDETNSVLAGHGRLAAADMLGIEEVPCVVLDGLTAAQKKAYIIADNQLALNATWNMDTLKLEIDTLDEMDFPLVLLGIGEDLQYLLDDDGLNMDDVTDADSDDTDDDVFKVVIECDSQEQQTKLFERLTEEGLNCQYVSI